MSIDTTLATDLMPSRVEPFDAIAAYYDRIFTDSPIGKAQRAQVTGWLNQYFPPGSRALELNCGTGEDALALARRGVEVTAFDASPAMVDVASRRLLVELTDLKVTFGVLRNEDLGHLSDSYDGAFSNFAGLNCSGDWAAIAAELSRLIEPGGHLLLCIMGRVCLWEIACSLLAGNRRKALRRMTSGTIAQVGESALPVFYPSLGDARRSFSHGFTLDSWRGVGVFVPPSNFDRFMRNHPTLLRLLQALDLRLGHLPGIRRCGDHLLLHFVRNQR